MRLSSQVSVDVVRGMIQSRTKIICPAELQGVQSPFSKVIMKKEIHLGK